MSKKKIAKAINSESDVFSVAAGTGKYRLTARVISAGTDRIVIITGGDSPHVGAVAAAYGIADPERAGCREVSVSVITLPGHREDEIARSMARTLTKRFGVNVAVSAGMHWDGITPRGIETVIRNSGLLCEIIQTKWQQTMEER